MHAAMHAAKDCTATSATAGVVIDPNIGTSGARPIEAALAPNSQAAKAHTPDEVNAMLPSASMRHEFAGRATTQPRIDAR
jgi:hypothetical protein